MSSHIAMGLPNPNATEFYNCSHCGSEVKRKLFSPIFAGDKPITRSTYIFPACSCMTAIIAKDEKKKERRQRRSYMEQVYKQNLMNDSLMVASFNSFIERPGTEIPLREAKKFANNFESQKTGILLYGDPGNGKSHLCASIHHKLDEDGHVSLFLEVQRLLNLTDDARKFSSKVNLNDVINAAIQADLLTLDELGAGKLTQDDLTDVLFPIINGRMGKPTNYTTNLNLDELMDWFASDKYGRPLDNKGRLIDRLLGSCEAIQNNGTSKRQEDALKRMSGESV